MLPFRYFRTDPKWKPLLLVIPLRLGLSELNPVYIPGLKAVFESPQNVGIMGGRPNHALFFIGYAGTYYIRFIWSFAVRVTQGPFVNRE